MNVVVGQALKPPAIDKVLLTFQYTCLSHGQDLNLHPEGQGASVLPAMSLCPLQVNQVTSIKYCLQLLNFYDYCYISGFCKSMK